MAAVEQAVFTTLCMVSDQAGRILVQERIGTAWDGLAFPGGHVESGESFVESVIREVWEETGYQIKTPSLCGIKQFSMENGGRYVILLFKSDRFEGHLQSSPEGRVFWLKRSRIKEYPLARDLDLMLELFESEDKSEFYYAPDGSCRLL
ncbi:8-oxo-dGTP diphosphatase [Lachnotalea sp. AF33-28]|nr:8-oxo-dGTP diphosphatase [Lachnotalea sp. AF33-28]